MLHVLRKIPGVGLLILILVLGTMSARVRSENTNNQANQVSTVVEKPL